MDYKNKTEKYFDTLAKKFAVKLKELDGSKKQFDEIEKVLKSGKSPDSGWEAQVSKLVSDVRVTKDESNSILSQLQTTKAIIVDGTDKKRSILADISSAKADIEDFRESVFGGKDGKLQDGQLALEGHLNKQRANLDVLSAENEELLKNLTDKGVDSAFTGIATSAWWRGLSALAISIIILCFMAYSSYSTFTDGFELDQVLSKFTFLIPLGFAVWLLNRERKVQQIIEIQYRYKSALAKALNGYRKLYDLPHSSTEYMELFNVLKEELLENPMKHARRYLDQDFFPTSIKVPGVAIENGEGSGEVELQNTEQKSEKKTTVSEQAATSTKSKKGN